MAFLVSLCMGHVLNQSLILIFLKQILEGLAFLASKRLGHGSLTCSKVLVTAEGEIKIGTPETRLVDLSLTWNTASQECCREIGSSNVASLQDVRALGYIAM
jgi:hypothetical protein